jgi:Heterokaryon incompatibility protein (HET)
MNQERLANAEIDISEVSVVEQQLHSATPYGPIQPQASLPHEGEFSPEIRLFLLSSMSETQSGLYGSLETFRLSDAPPYIAVSYEWGGPLISLKDDVNLQIQYHQLPLKPNLAQALTCFREQFKQPRFLWIDSICIYSYRTAMKRLGNLRFMSQFSEEFHFCLGAEKLMLCAFKMYYIYPDLCFIHYHFRSGKGARPL